MADDDLSWLTQDEKTALTALLRRAIADDRYPVSPRNRHAAGHSGEAHATETGAVPVVALGAWWLWLAAAAAAGRPDAADLLISNQVSKGFEQLGNDKLVVWLGGIYALEGVMNMSEQYHQPALEVMSGFVRDGTRNEMGEGPPAAENGRLPDRAPCPGVTCYRRMKVSGRRPARAAPP